MKWVSQILVIILCLGIALPFKTHANLSQKEELEKAAKGADKAADSNETMSMVWAGVGAVCLTSCIASMSGGEIIGGGAEKYICMFSSLGAGITDAIMTEKVESALMGAAGPAVTLASGGLNSGAAKTSAAGAAKGASKDYGSCVSAAVAILQAFMKNNDAKEERKDAKENRKQAEKLALAQGGAVVESGKASAPVPVILPIPPNPPSFTSGTIKSAASRTDGGTVVALTAAKTGDCSGAVETRSAPALLACAVANDQHLPPAVTSQGFLREFSKISHQDFATFVNHKPWSPADAMREAVRPSLKARDFSRISTLLGSLEREFQKSTPERVSGNATASVPSSVLSNSTSAAQKQENQEAPFENRMPAQNKTPPSTLSYDNPTRSSDSIAEDTGISLFDRVTSRYQSVYRKMLLAN